MIAGRVVNLEETVRDYTRLFTRIGKKLPNAIVDLDIKSGKGTAAPLVGSIHERERYRTETRAWCIRKVSPSRLLLGAACEFGLNQEDPAHAVPPDPVVHNTKGLVSVEASVNVSSFFVKLMTINGKKSTASDAR